MYRKLNGIAEGIAGVVKDCIIPTVHGTVQTVGCAVWRKGTRCTGLEQGVEVTEDNNVTVGKQSEVSSNPTTNTNGQVVESDDPAKDRSFRGTIMSALSLEKFESK